MLPKEIIFTQKNLKVPSLKTYKIVAYDRYVLTKYTSVSIMLPCIYYHCLYVIQIPPLSRAEGLHLLLSLQAVILCTISSLFFTIIKLTKFKCHDTCFNISSHPPLARCQKICAVQVLRLLELQSFGQVPCYQRRFAYFHVPFSFTVEPYEECL